MNQTIILIIYLSNKSKTTWRKLFVVHIVSWDRIGIHQIGSTMTCRWAAFGNVWIMLWSPIVAKFMGSHQICFSGDDSENKNIILVYWIMYRHTCAFEIRDYLSKTNNSYCVDYRNFWSHLQVLIEKRIWLSFEAILVWITDQGNVRSYQLSKK